MTKERWLAWSSLTRPFSRRDGWQQLQKDPTQLPLKYFKNGNWYCQGFYSLTKKTKTKQPNNIRTSQMTKPLMKTIPWHEHNSPGFKKKIKKKYQGLLAQQLSEWRDTYFWKSHSSENSRTFSSCSSIVLKISLATYIILIIFYNPNKQIFSFKDQGRAVVELWEG